MTLSSNLLTIAGDLALQADGYINFGSTTGSTGYGIRDNAGTMEFKDSTGSWASFQSLATGSQTQWQLVDKVLSPDNSTLDLAVGGTATSSAKFLVEGLTGETFINANSLTDGFGLSMVSTSNLLSTGGLAQFLWNPSAPTTATGDLFVIDVNGNATITGLVCG
jgi:hypothetical protein